jgi:hypothetical protein
MNSPADKSDKSTTAVSSSKYTPSLTGLQLSELILTSPYSVVSPVYSPANQQNIKSGKNVRTPPPHGQFGGSLVPCGAIPSRENYVNHWAPGYYQASLFAEHGHFIGILRLEVSWSALLKATLFTIHSRGPERCAIPSRRSSAHIDSFKHLFPDRSNRDSSWIHPPPGSWIWEAVLVVATAFQRPSRTSCSYTMLSPSQIRWIVTRSSTNDEGVVTVVDERKATRRSANSFSTVGG